MRFGVDITIVSSPEMGIGPPIRIVSFRLGGSEDYARKGKESLYVEAEYVVFEIAKEPSAARLINCITFLLDNWS
jgi:hypothetical protein